MLQLYFAKLQLQLKEQELENVRYFLVSDDYQTLLDVEEEVLGVWSNNITNEMVLADVAGRFLNISLHFTALMEQKLDAHVELSFEKAKHAEVAAIG